MSDRYGAGRVPRRRNYISGDACLIVGVVSGVIGTWRDNTQTIVSGIWCLALWVALELRFGRQP